MGGWLKLQLHHTAGFRSCLGPFERLVQSPDRFSHFPNFVRVRLSDATVTGELLFRCEANDATILQSQKHSAVLAGGGSCSH